MREADTSVRKLPVSSPRYVSLISAARGNALRVNYRRLLQELIDSAKTPPEEFDSPAFQKIRNLQELNATSK